MKKGVKSKLVDILDLEGGTKEEKAEWVTEPSLYTGIQRILHLYLRYLVKTLAEGVVESNGNYVEIHSDKRQDGYL